MLIILLKVTFSSVTNHRSVWDILSHLCEKVLTETSFSISFFSMDDHFIFTGNFLFPCNCLKFVPLKNSDITSFSNQEKL